jgi:hypothetical protein
VDNRTLYNALNQWAGWLRVPPQAMSQTDVANLAVLLSGAAKAVYALMALEQKIPQGAPQQQIAGAPAPQSLLVTPLDVQPIPPPAPPPPPAPDIPLVPMQGPQQGGTDVFDPAAGEF